MKLITKKCGGCDTFQFHIDGHLECVYCEELNSNLIKELIEMNENE